MKNSAYPFFLLVLLVSSCSGDQFEAEVPTYLVVDQYEFKTTFEEGSSSNDIRDVWVFENNNALGAYELPAAIPIIGDEPKNIQVFAGIRENGNSNYPRLFFMYSSDTFSFDPDPGNEVQFTPEFEYDERTQFAFIEDFEESNLFGTSLGGSDTTVMNFTSEVVFEGNRSGTIRVNEERPTVVVGTNDAYGPFFERGNQAFLELDYKNDVPVTIGYLGVNSRGEQVDFFKVTLLPSENWRKAYINFSEEFRGDDIVSVRMVIRVDLDRNFFDGEVGDAFFDNIKLIHF